MSRLDDSSNCDREEDENEDEEEVCSSSNSNSNNSNDEWKSIDENSDLDDESPHWANFPSTTTTTTVTNDDEDNWADFQSSEIPNDEMSSFLSDCFPLESPIIDRHYPELPSFTTFDGPTKTLENFLPSLSLWKILSNVSTDPVGIQFQWAKSQCERLFHRALNVESIPIFPDEKLRKNSDEISSIDQNDVVNLSPDFDWKQTDAEIRDDFDTKLIKTTDLFPGSTKLVVQDEMKKIVDFTPINPTALLFPSNN